MENTENKTSDAKGMCCATSVMHSSRVQGALTLVLILLAAFLFAQTINALKGYRYIGSDVQPISTITVAGEGEKLARPDTAEFTFTVYEEGDTAVAVQDAVSAKAGEIVDALKEQGISEDDIKVLTYALNIKYDWEPAVCAWGQNCDRKRVQNGFTLRQVVQVTSDDLSKTAELVAIATEKGASEVGALSFTVGEADTYKEEARAMAIQDAQQKAEQLATDLGVTLVRVVGYNEDVFYPVMQARSYAMDEAMGMGGALESAPVLPVGENQITSNVNVTYEIR